MSAPSSEAPAASPSRRRALAPRAAFFLALFALLCALRLPLADRPIRDVDEAVSALIATSWLEGGVPYRDAIDQRGPVTYLLYAATFLLAGKNNMLAVHWALLLLILAGCWLLYRFGNELARDLGLDEGMGGSAGTLAAFLLAISSFTYRRSQMLAFHTEWPILIFSTLGMLALWRGLSRGARPRTFLWAGLAFGASFLSKQPAVFDGMAAGGFLLLWQWKEGLLWRRETLVRALALAGGFCLAVAGAVAYFAAHGALGDFYLYFWSYNVEHYTAVVPLADRLAALNPWEFRRHYLRANPLLFAAAVVAGARAAFGLAQWGRRAVNARLLVTLWLLAAFFGASYGGRNFGHYFIQLLAPACLTAALLLRELWLAAGRAGAWRGFAPALLRSLLVVTVAVGLALPLWRYRRDLALLSFDQPARPNVPREKLLAFLAETTRPEDKIFVWGYDPEVYVLSGRRPATRYSNANYLTGLLPWENHRPGVDTSAHIVPGAWDILMRELEATPPVLIIDTSPGDHRTWAKYPVRKFPRLAAYLERHYEPVAALPDRKGRTYYVVYRRL
ncbi:MAG TPA: glycosyltransferase family 39 protein [Thermoanaerobaculia bacterium]|nr:glycosyltransferase family 39 protein [Thermoanaerobaculia bacterium]